MTPPATLRRTILTAAWLLVPCLALAQREQLPLKHGTYVLANIACKEPPLAAMISWDGVGFSGSRFSVTTCSALGDGTPNPSGQVYVETLSVTRLSNARISMSSDAKQPATYRWCSAK
jgi:hypothetical protein